jgi:hypothetical protein
MKPIMTFLSFFVCIHLFACCNKSSEMISSPYVTPITDSVKLKITIDTNTFTASIYNNATVAAFKKSLPITIDMKDLNGNEKYHDLPNNLPSNASNPGTIQTGDLMLYGSNTLVLFYKSFSTSYNYSELGRIEDTAGLTAALGSDNVIVTFALQEITP